MSKDYLSNQPNSDSPKGIARGYVQRSFSGPLPPPEVLEKFNEVVPGSAERIIKMAEDQFIHRSGLENKVIDSDIVTSKRGQILGFVIAIVGLVVSLVAIINGSQLAGSVIGGGTLASLVGVFMYGSRIRSRERESKNKNEE